VKVRGWNSIGPAQVIVEQEREGARRGSGPQEIARITIPDDQLAGVVAELLLRCYQQNLVTGPLWDVANVINEDKRP
jgi:hypothetical protein